MVRVMQGAAWVFEGLLDVDWGLAPYGAIRDSHDKGVPQTYEEMAKYAMVGVDPDFPRKVQKGDFVVAGEGAGYGHDHDYPCKALRGAGVAALLCESANANFLRNSIDHGLPVVECRGVNNIVRHGDRLEVDLGIGTVKNLTTGAEATFAPFPDFILDMLDAGGLYPYLERRMKAGTL